MKDGEELFLAVPNSRHRPHGPRSHAARLIQRVSIDEQVHQTALITARAGAARTVDHAVVSGWLLEKWQFPERTQQVVAASHDPERLPKQKLERRVCSLRGIGEPDRRSLSRHGRRPPASQSSQNARRPTSRSIKKCSASCCAEIGKMIPDAETIFETEILSVDAWDKILEEAREALMLRNLPGATSRRRSENGRRVPRATYSARLGGIQRARSAHESLQPRAISTTSFKKRSSTAQRAGRRSASHSPT